MMKNFIDFTAKLARRLSGINYDKYLKEQEFIEERFQEKLNDIYAQIERDANAGRRESHFLSDGYIDKKTTFYLRMKGYKIKDFYLGERDRTPTGKSVHW